MEPTSYLLLGAGFLGLTLVMYSLLFSILKRAIAQTNWDAARKQGMTNRFLMVFIGWSVFLLAVSATGFFADFSAFPPRIMIVLAIPLVTIIVFTRSATARDLLAHIPSRTMLNMQAFRIPVELLIWGGFIIGELPIQMTFEGLNLDIISGLAGPIVAFFLVNNRLAVYSYNFLALGLLINIVTVAILSLPTPFRYFMEGPANVLVTRAPFVLLPGMLVPLAYGLSFLSLRQLRITQQPPTTTAP